MSFLALVVALLLVQWWGSGEPVQRDAWFSRLAAVAGDLPLAPAWQLAAAIALPVLIAAGLLGALEDILFGALWIVLAVLLLLYALGRGDFRALLDRYRERCGNGDFAGAWLSLPPGLAGMPAADPADAQELQRLARRLFFYEGFQRWFAVLFYYLLFGPAGALAYRLLQLSRGGWAAPTAQRWLLVVDWLPCRLLAATFALGGDFVRSREALLNALVTPAMAAIDVLDSVGSAAIVAGGPQPDVPVDSAAAVAETRELSSLLSRSAAGWVALVALLVLLD